MMYYNTIFHYGVEAFVDACIESGVDGLIIPDLPLEEQDEIKEFYRRKMHRFLSSWYLRFRKTESLRF